MLNMKTAIRTSVNMVPAFARGWIKHIPIIAPAQRWLVRRFLSGEAFIHRVDSGPAAGLLMEISLPDDKAIWLGRFENAFAAAIRDGITRGSVCYDIGSYRGYMAGVMALAGASRVFAFEPLPQNVSALSRLCDLNPTLPITALPFAIGATDGKVGFKVMPDNSMGKLNTSGFQAEAAAKSEFLVEMRALDSLIFGSDRYPHPDVLKIDVEGAELDVLTGAKRALQESMPVLFIETHSRALDEQCRNFLTGIGYVLTPLREPTASEPTGHLMAAAPLRP